MEQIGTSWIFSRLFESVVRYFDAFLTLIPLSFVLGFYVSFVASRWWQQFLAIPWPDKLYHSIALYIPGYDEESRMLRRCLIRWMNLALILVLRYICCCCNWRCLIFCMNHILMCRLTLSLSHPLPSFLSQKVHLVRSEAEVSHPRPRR